MGQVALPDGLQEVAALSWKDEHCFAVAAEGCSIFLYDASDLASGPVCVRSQHKASVKGLAFSPPGAFPSRLLASASDDCTVRLWDSETEATHDGEPIRHTDAATAVAWHPTEPYYVSVGWDRKLHSWQVKRTAAAAGDCEPELSVEPLGPAVAAP